MRWMSDRRVVVAGLGTSGVVAHWLSAPARKSAPSVTTDSPGVEPRRDLVPVAHPPAQLDPPAGEAAVRRRDEDERQVLVVPQHRRDRHQEAGARRRGRGSSPARTCPARSSRALFGTTTRTAVALVAGSTSAAM